MLKVNNTIEGYGNIFTTVRRRFKTTLFNELRSMNSNANYFILPKVKCICHLYGDEISFVEMFWQNLSNIFFSYHFAIYSITKAYLKQVRFFFYAQRHRETNVVLSIDHRRCWQVKEDKRFGDKGQHIYT